MPKQPKAFPATQPMPGHPFFAKSRGTDDLSSHRHRQAIGWLGVSLPWVLVLSNLLRRYPNTGDFWDSISLYFYSAGNALFCGILFALFVFLMTYRGYGNAGKKWDIFFGVIAAIAALIVASFPTTPKGPVLPMPWSTASWPGVVHLTAAITLFACFIVFSLFLFTRNAKSEGLIHFEWPAKKRDRLYVVCGYFMLVMVLWALVNNFNGGSIFWQESGALEAFGVSWLAKSRVEHTVGRLKTAAVGLLSPGQSR